MKKAVVILFALTNFLNMIVFTARAAPLPAALRPRCSTASAYVFTCANCLDIPNPFKKIASLSCLQSI